MTFHVMKLVALKNQSNSGESHKKSGESHKKSPAAPKVRID
jgi:hypothetical protein